MSRNNCRPPINTMLARILIDIDYIIKLFLSF